VGQVCGAEAWSRFGQTVYVLRQDIGCKIYNARGDMLVECAQVDIHCFMLQQFGSLQCANRALVVPTVFRASDT
jgi:hypothetical protein